MKALILVTALLCAGNLSAEDKAPAKNSDRVQTHMQMHASMAKAHQQAADCLKSGKSEDECRKDFQKMCTEAGTRGNCGMWMMNQ